MGLDLQYFITDDHSVCLILSMEETQQETHIWILFALLKWSFELFWKEFTMLFKILYFPTCCDIFSKFVLLVGPTAKIVLLQLLDLSHTQCWDQNSFIWTCCFCILCYAVFDFMIALINYFHKSLAQHNSMAGKKGRVEWWGGRTLMPRIDKILHSQNDFVY